MKIIFYRYNSICEPDLIDAFIRLGIDVVEDNDGMNLKMDVSDKLTRLGNMIAENRPLFVFSVNYFPFLSIMCEKLKITYIAESVDCPVFEIYHKSIANKKNKVFLFDRQQYLSIRDENPEGIFYLPLGAASERTSNFLGDAYDPQYDVSFVGSLYLEKDLFNNLKLPENMKEHLLEIMHEQIKTSCHGMALADERVSDSDIKCIKSNALDFYPSDQSVRDLDKFVVLNDYIAPHIAYLERVEILNAIAEEISDMKMHLFTRSDTSAISKKVIIHDGVRSLDQMPVVFRNSKINLNISLRSIQSGLPQRIWDVLACRGFLLTNDQPEIDEMFKSGVHLETYSCREELIDKIRYYSEHDSERDKIAQKGYEEVSERHTVLIRAAEMIKRAFA